VLVANAAKYTAAQFLLQTPPRPPHWGGYGWWPDEWQFWQGRKSRLHDRLLGYLNRAGAKWGGMGAGRGWTPECAKAGVFEIFRFFYCRAGASRDASLTIGSCVSLL
jgi:hypothetical protein